MRTRYLIPLVFCVLWLCGASYAVAEELPMYTGAAVISQDTYEGVTNNTYTLPKDAKREDVLAFYQDKLKLGEWTPSVSIDGPWLYLRSFARTGRAFGLAVYGDNLLLLNATTTTDTTIADWVRETVLLASPPVAKVGSDEISYAEYYHRAERMLCEVDPNTGVGTQSGQMAVKYLIYERLWLKMALDRGVPPTEEQVAKKFADRTKYYSENRHTDITEGRLKDELRVQQAVFNIEAKGVIVTPEEIADEYNKHLADITIPKMVSLAGIFLKSKEDADKVMALLKGGAEFGTLARTMSKHESAKNNGKLTPIPRNAEGIPEAAKKIIFSTPVGKYTRPLDTGDGLWVIFMPLQYIPENVRKLDEVADEIRDRLLMRKGMKKNPRIMDEIKKMFEASDIEIAIKRYQEPILHPTKKPAGE